jgi:hypothetical protein
VRVRFMLRTSSALRSPYVHPCVFPFFFPTLKTLKFFSPQGAPSELSLTLTTLPRLTRIEAYLLMVSPSAAGRDIQIVQLNAGIYGYRSGRHCM